MNVRLANALDYVLAHVRDGLRVAPPPTRIKMQVYRNPRTGKLIADSTAMAATVYGTDISALMARVTEQLQQTYGEGPFIIEIDQAPSALQEPRR